MRDECKKILLNNNQGRKTKNLFKEWNPDLHSKTGNKFRFLDNIFTDESVGEIMFSYYFEANCDHSKVFNVLQEKNINGFYSKHELTNKYSDYAIKNFGFPNDNATDDALDSDNSNED